MEVSELKKQKKKLEDDIMNLIYSFEVNTTTCVESVTSIKSAGALGTDRLFAVKVDIRLD